ncbi:MAG TPA: ankyrin repeat domain-containing protein [Terracidiphilus sp.]|nr:ankyrin repeat domain-containing protein [Terracidiphilus sp.]
MNQNLLRLIQSGSTGELADAIVADPSLAEYRDPQGVSALLWTIYTGQAAARDFFLARLAERGVELDIFEASALGDEARLRTIVTADPAAAQTFSGDGWTPLHLAAAFGTPAAVALLLHHGATVDAVSKNPQRNQPLHAALALGRNSMTIQLLLDRGADTNAVQAGGFTAIFSAATANRRDLAELLVAHGANPRHVTDQGKTAAQFARERGFTELADWLDMLPDSA